MNAADVFCELLRARLTLGQHELAALLDAPAVYRADPLFEAGADLVDVLIAFEACRVNETVVREQALRVATLSAQLYLATTGGQTVDEGDDDGADR